MLDLMRRFGIVAAIVALAGATAGCAGGGDSSPLPTPTTLVAEGGDTVVDLSWAPVPGARKYIIYWADATVPVGSALPNRVKYVYSTSWRHSGLTNLQTYRYRIVAVAGDRKSAPSGEVSAEPGPVPEPVEWAIVVTQNGANNIYFSPSAQSDRYRVYYADTRGALSGRRPPASFVEVTTSPATAPPVPPGQPAYYRVIGMNGPRIGTGGYAASATEFIVRDVKVPYETPSLWDVNGDGCLDMIGANGDCTGGFQNYPWNLAGLSELFLDPNRKSRDARLADFNGDGKADIISNVYSRADDPNSFALLLTNDGSGKFVEDPAITAMHIGGFGETIVVADFNNDGYLDIFIPNYWHLDDGGRNWLLINDGKGGFVDRAEAAGVARGPAYLPYQPEAAEAIDFNEDGWIDLHVASMLFINNHDGTFTDHAADYNLPIRFDEGMKFTDVDMDGKFDLVLNDSYVTTLYRNIDGKFDAGTYVAGDLSRTAFVDGLAVCDVNGDGFEDVLIPSVDPVTKLGAPQLLINVNGTLVPSDYGAASPGTIDLMACADLDRNGLTDVLARWAGYKTMLNVASSPAILRIRVLGAAGERNQQGRVVRIQPKAVPNRHMVRVIESGSGYMAQGDYDLLVGAPWDGDYDVSVRFKDRVVTGTMRQGESATFYEDGRVVSGLQ